ncbi:MAG TPA: DedA family protein [Gemmatimonadales bacterium]|jgi:membrane-associated protein|nr:DedA family protein [Gemmatimonadales bacterium]
MQFLRDALDFLLHLDRHLAELIAQYGGWTYGILALIVFSETGLVIAPFLPGDSLLFTAGALAALGSLDPRWLNLLLFVAVLSGDNLNYWIGRFIGPRAFTDEYRFFRREHLLRTHAFFERHGGRTVVLARFVPIVRTFTPFVAGIGAMRYSRFLAYSIVGGAFWVTAFLWAGYYFGNLPVIRANFSLVVLGIIVVSVLPIAIGLWRERRRARS